jgi:hypothetical protein
MFNKYLFIKKFSKQILHLIERLYIGTTNLKFRPCAKLKAYLSWTIRTQSILLLCTIVAKKWIKCSITFHYTMLPCFPLRTQFWLHMCIWESSDIFPQSWIIQFLGKSIITLCSKAGNNLFSEIQKTEPQSNNLDILSLIACAEYCQFNLEAHSKRYMDILESL